MLYAKITFSVAVTHQAALRLVSPAFPRRGALRPAVGSPLPWQERLHVREMTRLLNFLVLEAFCKPFKSQPPPGRGQPASLQPPASPPWPHMGCGAAAGDGMERARGEPGRPQRSWGSPSRIAYASTGLHSFECFLPFVGTDIYFYFVFLPVSRSVSPSRQVYEQLCFNSILRCLNLHHKPPGEGSGVVSHTGLVPPYSRAPILVKFTGETSVCVSPALGEGREGRR